jgi:group I intron endonuclease
MKKSGIYEIVNIQNNKKYIGSAVNLELRQSQHFSKLRKNYHENRHLQRAYNKYGEEQFVFNILEEVDSPELLVEREQYHIDKYTFENLYNIRIEASSNFGFKHSDETKVKMSAVHKGVPKPPRSAEHRRNISNAHKGKKRKPLSQATKDKISEAHKGRVFTNEHKTKLSKAQKGSTRPPRTDEHRAKIGAANKGKVISPEHREKLRQANLDKILSQEHKAAISKRHSKRVAKINRDTNETIMIYQSVALAAKDVRTSASGIARCARGDRPSAAGFRWEYLD